MAWLPDYDAVKIWNNWFITWTLTENDNTRAVLAIPVICLLCMLRRRVVSVHDYNSHMTVLGVFQNIWRRMQLSPTKSILDAPLCVPLNLEVTWVSFRIHLIFGGWMMAVHHERQRLRWHIVRSEDLHWDFQIWKGDTGWQNSFGNGRVLVPSSHFQILFLWGRNLLMRKICRSYMFTKNSTLSQQ